MGILSSSQASKSGLDIAKPKDLPEFALFFRQPQWPQDANFYPNFCFDDGLASAQTTGTEAVLQSWIEVLNEQRFITPANFVGRFEHLKFRWRHASNPTNCAKNPRRSAHRKSYCAPWLGFPVSRVAGTTARISISLTNALNSYVGKAETAQEYDPYADGAILPNTSWDGDDDEDGHWRCELPDGGTLKLELESDDPALVATWGNGDSTTLSFQLDGSGTIDESVTLTFTTPPQDTVWPPFDAEAPPLSHQWPFNEDRPRTVKVIWKSKVVAQLSVIVMPLLPHYVAFVGVRHVVNANGSIDYILDALGPGTGAGPQIPIPTSDSIPPAPNYLPDRLGDVAVRFFSQFGVDLNIVDDFTFSLPSTVNASQTVINVTSGDLPASAQQFFTMLKSTFLDSLTGVNSATNPGLTPRNLSICFLASFVCTPTAPSVPGVSSPSQEGGLGSGPVPTGICTEMEIWDYLKNTAPPSVRAGRASIFEYLGDDNEYPHKEKLFVDGVKHRDMLRTYPHQAVLFSDLTSIPWDELTLCHELCHNFGLDHTFPSQFSFEGCNPRQAAIDTLENFAFTCSPGVVPTHARRAAFNGIWDFTRKPSQQKEIYWPSDADDVLSVVEVGSTPKPAAAVEVEYSVTNMSVAKVRAHIPLYFSVSTDFLSAHAGAYQVNAGVWSTGTLGPGMSHRFFIRSRAGYTAPPPSAPIVLEGSTNFFQNLRHWHCKERWDELAAQLNVEECGTRDVLRTAADTSFDYFDILNHFGYGSVFRVAVAGSRLTLRGLIDDPNLTPATGGVFGPRSTLYPSLPLASQSGLSELDFPASAPTIAFKSSDAWIHILRCIAALYAHKTVAHSGDLYSSTYPRTYRGPGEQGAGNLMDYCVGGLNGGRTKNPPRPDGLATTNRSYLCKYQWDILRHSARVFCRAYAP